MEVKDHGEPGGDTRDSARQERQESVPAQGNGAQVEQVRASSAAVTPPGSGERGTPEGWDAPSAWRSSEISQRLTPSETDPGRGFESHPSPAMSPHGHRHAAFCPVASDLSVEHFDAPDLAPNRAGKTGTRLCQPGRRRVASSHPCWGSVRWLGTLGRGPGLCHRPGDTEQEVTPPGRAGGTVGVLG